MILRVGEYEVELEGQPRGTEGEVRVLRVAHLPSGLRSAGLEGQAVTFVREREGIRLLWSDRREDWVLDRRTESGRVEYRALRTLDGKRFPLLEVRTPAEEKQNAGASRGSKVIKIKAQMPGKVTRVMVKPEQRVSKGQSMLVLEAMKMENEIRAPIDGVVQRISVTLAQAVESGAELLLLSPLDLVNEAAGVKQ